MNSSQTTRIVYVTSNTHKREENRSFVEHCQLRDGTPVGDIVSFDFRDSPVLQILEVDIAKIVSEGVAKAYSQIRVPCIVEYAGLIFEKYRSLQYPGGLTKAMWNALSEDFIKETNSAGLRAIAQAVIGYCDGKKIYTFAGETTGTLSDVPRGSRDFYWDTVFMPDKPDGTKGTETYSEIVADPSRGLDFKMKHLSQSAKAMIKLVEFLRINPRGGLWR